MAIAHGLRCAGHLDLHRAAETASFVGFRIAHDAHSFSVVVLHVTAKQRRANAAIAAGVPDSAAGSRLMPDVTVSTRMPWRLCQLNPTSYR